MVVLPEHLAGIASDLAKELMLCTDIDKQILIMKVAMNISYNYGRDEEMRRNLRKEIRHGTNHTGRDTSGDEHYVVPHPSVSRDALEGVPQPDQMEVDHDTIQ